MLSMVPNLSLVTKNSLALSKWNRFTFCFLFRSYQPINFTHCSIASLRSDSNIAWMHRWGVVIMVRNYNFPPCVWTEIVSQMSTCTVISREFLNQCPLNGASHCLVNTEVSQLCDLELSLISIPFCLLRIMCSATFLFAWLMCQFHIPDEVLELISFRFEMNLDDYIKVISLNCLSRGSNIRRGFHRFAIPCYYCHRWYNASFFGRGGVGRQRRFH